MKDSASLRAEIDKNPCEVDNEHYYTWQGSEETMHPNYYCVTCGKVKTKDTPEYQIMRLD